MADRRAFVGERDEAIASLKAAAAAAAATPTAATMARFRKRATADLIGHLIAEAALAGAARALAEEVSTWRGWIRKIWQAPSVGFERFDIIEAAKGALDHAEWGKHRPPMEADGAIDQATLEPLNGRVTEGQVETIREGLAHLRAAEDKPDADLRFGDIEAMMEHPIDGPASDRKGKRRIDPPNADTVFQREQRTYNDLVAQAS